MEESCFRAQIIREDCAGSGNRPGKIGIKGSLRWDEVGGRLLEEIVGSDGEV